MGTRIVLCVKEGIVRTRIDVWEGRVGTRSILCKGRDGGSPGLFCVLREGGW